ncbi:methylated-DNA--[protein]-cysteine S-methyltransferase [Shimazuella alba]|uniref:Methylated-DNA--protein-cysteine methyltransferase n=1 Tax=Shimazuella alba TaxID=2690964 RepID=A0A6I4VRP3_9BACL|nr:methylated-DNA--[protein]-cysteine S-methyltransferase [Shimazuella alba]MXQ52460.1 methylated-DNA--[protein]-cysteine S-methyltransferase [Shimazuella alba]
MNSNQTDNTIVYWSEISSSFFQNSSFYIAATELGLCRVLFPNDPFENLQSWILKNIPNALLIKDARHMEVYEQQLQEYFLGKRKHFLLPLDMRGTKFRVDVWKALQQIPYGEIRSYADIAESIGNPKAVRAVGTANGANPIPIIVPCHRVIGKNKTLTGFGGGLTNKKKLLHLEGYNDYIDIGHARYQF